MSGEATTIPLSALIGEELRSAGQALRAAVAMLVTLAIAFRLNLDSPGSAAITVVILSLSTRGQVLEKSFYRLIGTLVGGGAALLMVVMFSQQRALFVLAVALWIGVAVVGSAWLRNFRAYACVLAGYTACLVGFPAIQHPEMAFRITEDRMIAVALGIACASLASGLVFPQSIAPTLVGTIRRRVPQLIETLEHLLQGTMGRSQWRRSHVDFARDIVSLDALRGWGGFETPSARFRNPRLRLLNSDFMRLTTILNALHRFREGLQAQGEQAVVTRMDAYLKGLVEAINGPDQVPRTALEAAPAAQRLRQWLDQEQVPQEAPANMRRGYWIVHQFACAVLDYLESYADLQRPRAHRQSRAPSLIPYADPGPALLSGLRATLTVAAMGAFWIQSGWTYGFPAILLASVACSLFAAAPEPMVSVKGMFRGFAWGGLAAFLFYALVEPRLDGMLMLALGMLPFLLVGTRWLGRLETAGQGTGFCLMMFSAQTLSNQMQVDIAGLINQSLATFIGLGAAMVAFLILRPLATPEQALKRVLVRQITSIAHQPRVPDRHRAESHIRDLMVQRLASPKLTLAQRGRIVDLSLCAMQAVYGLIHIRGLAPGKAVRRQLEPVTHAFTAVDRDRLSLALKSLSRLEEAAHTNQSLALPERIRAEASLHVLAMALEEWHELNAANRDEAEEVARAA